MTIRWATSFKVHFICASIFLQDSRLGFEAAAFKGDHPTLFHRLVRNRHSSGGTCAQGRGYWQLLGTGRGQVREIPPEAEESRACGAASGGRMLRQPRIDRK